MSEKRFVEFSSAIQQMKCAHESLPLRQQDERVTMFLAEYTLLAGKLDRAMDLLHRMANDFRHSSSDERWLDEFESLGGKYRAEEDPFLGDMGSDG